MSIITNGIHNSLIRSKLWFSILVTMHICNMSVQTWSSFFFSIWISNMMMRCSEENLLSSFQCFKPLVMVSWTYHDALDEEERARSFCINGIRMHSIVQKKFETNVGSSKTAFKEWIYLVTHLWLVITSIKMHQIFIQQFTWVIKACFCFNFWLQFALNQNI